VGVIEVAEVVAGQPERHRVDREVPPAEVLAQRRRLDGRERPRPLIGLPARPGEVEREAVRLDRRGAEALVIACLAAQPVGQRAGG
jgi:hypothetical protein